MTFFTFWRFNYFFLSYNEINVINFKIEQIIIWWTPNTIRQPNEPVKEGTRKYFTFFFFFFVRSIARVFHADEFEVHRLAMC